MSRNYENMAGTVDKVRAIRSNKDEVLRLEVTVHIPTVFDNPYYGSDKVADDIIMSVPFDSDVNPGDLAVLSISFGSPQGQRFQAALEASNGDDNGVEILVGEDEDDEEAG